MIKRMFQRISALFLCVACVLAFAGSGSAAGLLTPADNSVPAMKIRDHKVDVVIEDGYAVTSVEQVFHNPNARDLEAIYSFPVPEKGAVAEFTVWIDGKPVSGEVFEKEEARRIYAEEKAAGRDAGLTEKNEYKTFDIRVSPVRAGQDTRIRLVYLQPANVDLGVGRYVYPLEDGGVDEQAEAFWTATEKVTGTFSFTLSLRSAYPVDALRLPGFPQASLTQSAPGDWRASISSSGPAPAPVPASGSDEEAVPVPAGWTPEGSVVQTGNQAGVQAGNQAVWTLNKDLVVYWRHAPGLPGGVDLITHRPDPAKPGTFMLTITPGDDLKPITAGRDWVFVLDISGSMSGKYATLVDGIHRAFQRMRPGDRFRIAVFNNRAWELTPGFVPVSPENVERYSREMINIKPSGGTNLYAGLSLGLSFMDADRTGSLALVTDGVANVGETTQRKFLELVGRQDVRLFTFVMGNSANRPLLDALARESHGFAMGVSNSDDIAGKLIQAVGKVGYEAMNNVELDISGVRVTDLAPKDFGSLYRGQQLVLFGHYSGAGAADVRLRGEVSGRETEYRTRFDFPETSSLNPEIERLWAYASIRELMHEQDLFGENPDMKQAATDLALEYGLVTDSTSMVVMREEQFAARKVERRNMHRLAEENTAREQRAQSPVRPSRVDTGAPMFTSSRPTTSGGGGGAFGPWSMLLLVPLVVARITRRDGRG